MEIAGKMRLRKLILILFTGLIVMSSLNAVYSDPADVVELEHTKLVNNIAAYNILSEDNCKSPEESSEQSAAGNTCDYMNAAQQDMKLLLPEREQINPDLKSSEIIKPDISNNAEDVFTRYKKKLALDKTVNNENFAFWPQKGYGTLSFSPEYRLNSYLSMQNVYSTNFLDKNKKSEFIFSIKPLNDDRVNLNVGASQVMFSEAVKPPHSQLNFSTRFKL